MPSWLPLPPELELLVEKRSGKDRRRSAAEARKSASNASAAERRRTVRRGTDRRSMKKKT